MQSRLDSCRMIRAAIDEAGTSQLNSCALALFRLPWIKPACQDCTISGFICRSPGELLNADYLNSKIGLNAVGGSFCSHDWDWLLMAHSGRRLIFWDMARSGPLHGRA
jgi:hypothetical protein